MKDAYARCWWCASFAGRGERVELVSLKADETRRELLCQGCASTPHRTIWLGWRRAE